MSILMLNIKLIPGVYPCTYLLGYDKCFHPDNPVFTIYNLHYTKYHKQSTNTIYFSNIAL